MGELSDRDLQRRFALDAGPGPARGIDDARSSAMIAGALIGAGFPPPIAGGPGGASGGAQGAAKAAGAKAAAASAAKGIAVGKLTLLAGGAITATLASVGWVALRAPREAAT